MKTHFHFMTTITAVALSFSLLFMACEKKPLDDQRIRMDEQKLASGSGSPTSITVNWNNWTHGVTYTVAKAIADFGHVSGFTQAEQARTMISEGRLRVKLLKDEYGADGGVISTTNVPEHDSYELKFKIKFHADFNFGPTGKGGRLGWGFIIGDGAGSVETGDGGSFRLAWDKDASGNAYFKPYAYFADQTVTSGTHFGKRYPATGSSLTGSVWYNIRMVFKANTYLNNNGRAELYINGVQVLDRQIRWTKDHVKRLVKQITFSNYRSGSGSQVTTNGLVYFDDFELNSLTPTYTPTWCDNAFTYSFHYDTISDTYYHLTRIKHKDSNGNVIRLRHGHSNSTAGEAGTDFTRRMDCCLAFNASMGKSDMPTGVVEPVGVQIINGTIVQNETYHRYTLGIKDDNFLLAYPPYETPTNILNDGVNDALTAFVPLIENYLPVSDTVYNSVGNSTVANPRQAIAQYGNGDILFLSCGGRGYEGVGMKAEDMVRIFSGLAVRFAYNLDGGGSVTTIHNGMRVTPLIDGYGTVERKRPNWLYVKYEH